MFDLAIVETGSGGDYVFRNHDLQVVNSGENYGYLGMFGGNIEESTVNNQVNEFSKDYWGNTLLMNSNQPIQFNSTVERTLKNTSLTSKGRSVIENAIIEDLKFIVDMGIPVSVSVSIVSTDRIDVELKISYPEQIKVIIMNFKKSAENGDFFLEDFNTDFF